MKTRYFYMLGSASAVGKTTLSEGLLSQLLHKGYQPEQLAYIKPMTQCTEKQAVTEFCEREQIAHRSIGGLVFTKGFTKAFIDGLTETSAILLQDILTEIAQISENKKIVIVDGIGGVSTGSVIGISNAVIAHSLAAPVVLVGKAGVGSAIDDTILSINFLRRQGIQNIALIYNKIPSAELMDIKHSLNKRLAELLPDIPVLDFIVRYRKLDRKNKHQTAENICQWFCCQS